MAIKGACSVQEMTLQLVQWKDGWDCLVNLACRLAGWIMFNLGFSWDYNTDIEIDMYI